ncbi:MAG: hypothetical protein AB7F65_05185 [Dehalococcoidia bacterium]
MAENHQCPDCGMRFEDAERYREHRAAEHPRAEVEDALQGNAQTGAEGVPHTDERRGGGA